jgi:glycosyltransferase involved in cell wall biosynthesis
MLDVVALLEKRGHDVGVFSMRHPENIPTPFEKYFPSFVGYNTSDSTVWERIMGIGRIFWSFETRRRMVALLEEWQPDIAHLHNIYHQLSPSILGPLKELGIPIIMTVHDYNLVSPDKDAYYPEVGKHYWKFLFFKKYSVLKRLLLVLKMYWQSRLRWYGNNVDRYIVPSRFVRDVLIGAGMPQERIVVIPHFIPDSERAAIVADNDEEYSGKPFALYFGSLSEEKEVNAIVGIFDALRIPIVLAGAQEDGFVLRQSAYAIPVGQKSQEELVRLIGRAACVVSASPLPETFGLIALESVASGKPFFGLRSGAYAEIIENGKNGFLTKDVRELREYVTFFSKVNTFFLLNKCKRMLSVVSVKKSMQKVSKASAKISYS